MKRKLELLAPAGDLEKLKIAITFGADAVYIGGDKFGLRAKAKNFTYDEMIEGLEFAHSRGKKVYVTLNIFAHNDDFYALEEYLLDLDKLGVDAVIVSDLGIFSWVREILPNMEIHISTQANTTNVHSVKMWNTLGAKRVVVARELNAKDLKVISDTMPVEFDIEAFVHGAMCISYSGRCLLSNYMTNRDANKGACAHPCRWKYNLVEETRPGEYMPIEEDERGTYIYNSKDLCMLEHIPELIECGVNSFKIEGRMKTAYYVGAVVRTYRTAIDDYLKDPKLYENKKSYYMEEIRKSSHRDFTTGFYFGRPDGNEQIYTNNSYIRNYDFCAVIKSYDRLTGYAIIEQRNKFVKGEEIEIFKSNGENVSFVIDEMFDENNSIITEAPHPKQIIKIKLPCEVAEFDMFRKSVE
ncbi:MAG: peptidase U32 family protein [Lachnospirales bacterium]